MTLVRESEYDKIEEIETLINNLIIVKLWKGDITFMISNIYIRCDQTPLEREEDLTLKIMECRRIYLEDMEATCIKK